MSNMVIACGGTGGHLYPGVAVALELRRRHPTARVVFAGTGRGSEAETVAGHGFDHVRVRSAGYDGVVLGWDTAFTCLLLCAAFPD